MDGSDNWKLLVIRKSKTPRLFKGVHRLSVDYCANSKAWVTTQLFEQCVIAFDCDMDKQGRCISIHAFVACQVDVLAAEHVSHTAS